jgi:hypothetical protein
MLQLLKSVAQLEHSWNAGWSKSPCAPDDYNTESYK